MISEQKKKVLEHFARGRKFYKLMQFEQARDEFAKAREIDPADGPSNKFYERCLEYIDNPPEEDWDGVYRMTEK